MIRLLQKSSEDNWKTRKWATLGKKKKKVHEIRHYFPGFGVKVDIYPNNTVRESYKEENLCFATEKDTVSHWILFYSTIIQNDTMGF